MREYSSVCRQSLHKRHNPFNLLLRQALRPTALEHAFLRLPFQGVHEMLMLGPACHHPGLPPVTPESLPVTSDMTAEETWNLAAIGYAPLKLVMGTAVYSLGVVGGIAAVLPFVEPFPDKLLKSIEKRLRDIGLSRLHGSGTKEHCVGASVLSERKDQERERTKRMSKYHALAERDIERLAKDWITQNPHQALRLSVDAHKSWHRCVCLTSPVHR